MWLDRAGNMFGARLHRFLRWLLAVVPGPCMSTPGTFRRLACHAIGLYLIVWSLMTDGAVLGLHFQDRPGGEWDAPAPDRDLPVARDRLRRTSSDGAPLGRGYVGPATAVGAADVGLAELLGEMYGEPILPLRPV